jgi:signal transduction histidine kinase
MIFGAAFVRLLPHPPNFAPIAAMALFGGAYFSKKWAAFLVPLTAMFVTDLILGFHETMWAVYLSFALIVVIGMTMLKAKKLGSIFFASVISSVSFFIITNFGIWLSTNYYAKTGAGLAACYTAALPFFHQTLLSDLFFAGVLFGTYHLIKQKLPQLAEIKA